MASTEPLLANVNVQEEKVEEPQHATEGFLTRAKHGVARILHLDGKNEDGCCARTPCATTFNRGWFKFSMKEPALDAPEDVEDVSMSGVVSDLRCLRPTFVPSIDFHLTTGAKHLAQSSGKYYYEVALGKEFSDEYPQIGWLTMEFEEKDYDGDGVGDDIHGWATDGVRHLRWHNGEEDAAWPRSWQGGDVVGLAIDIEGGQMLFSLNGQWVPDVQMTFKAEENSSFFPALTMKGHFVMYIPKGSWKFAPPDEDFQAWAESGSFARPIPINEPISVFEAARRVGQFFDMLQSDIPKLLKVFTAQLPQAHPLRGLFKPLPWTQGDSPKSITMTGEVQKNGPKYAAGDKVYAEFAYKTTRATDENLERLGTKAPDKRWRLCEIVSYSETSSTYTLKCEDLKHEQSEDLNRPEEDLKPAGSHEKGSIMHDILLKVGSSNISKYNGGLLAVLTICSTVLLQVYATFLLQEDCDPKATPVDCKMFDTLKVGGALGVGAFCVAVALMLIQFGLPWMYKLLMHFCGVPFAKFARQSLLTHVSDPVVAHLLSSTSGGVSMMLFAVYTGLLAAFGIFSGILVDTGIFAFGSLAANKFLFAANLLGDSGSVVSLRKQEILAVAELLRTKLPVNISRAELRHEMMALMNHETTVGSISLSKELLLIIACGMQVSEADSKRLRQVLVEGIYISNHLDLSGSPIDPKAMTRRGMVIDLFKDEVRVPHVMLHPEVERWLQQGSKMPWHLCVNITDVGAVALELRQQGLKAGVGCFTWRCTGSLEWASNEARDPTFHAEVAKAYIAEFSARNEALWVLAGEGDTNACKELLDAGALAPALVKLAYEGHEEVAQLLLERRAEVNAARADGITAAHFAAQRGHVGVMKLLLEHRADTEQAEFDGSAPLNLSAQKGYVAVAQLLLEYRADIEHTSNIGMAPLNLSAINGHVAVTQLLLEHRADTQHASNKSNTPLHLSAQRGYVAVAQLLLEHQADPNTANRYGFTPGAYAVEYSSDPRETLQKLVRYGADLQKSYFGRSLAEQVQEKFGEQLFEELEAIARDNAQVDANKEKAEESKVMGAREIDELVMAEQSEAEAEESEPGPSSAAEDAEKAEELKELENLQITVEELGAKKDKEKESELVGAHAIDQLSKAEQSDAVVAPFDDDQRKGKEFENLQRKSDQHEKDIDKLQKVVEKQQKIIEKQQESIDKQQKGMEVSSKDSDELQKVIQKQLKVIEKQQERMDKQQKGIEELTSIITALRGEMTALEMRVSGALASS
mmetsp:Transcript_1488/g.2531  ORF Transcript_1488/g.2531 Transcript_1488/m.2531 type:complete len:1262 (+) Transcript_1488:71-3856(+)